MIRRVLFTASTFSHIAQFHRPYLRAFRDLGFQVHVACGGAPVPIPEADLAVALPFEKRMSAPANFTAQRQLRRLMVENNYALITTHTSLAAFFTRRAAAGVRPRPPLVNVAHGYLFDDETPAWKRAILLTAERWTAAQTDLLLTMNKFDHQIALEHGLGRETHNIPGMGVDFSRLETTADEAAAWRHTYGFSPTDYVLLYAAEFSARKGQASLIRALPILPERVKLLLPGQGALLAECQALAASLGVSARVVFPGQTARMAPLYALADGAVSASRSEGLPFNIMEAMACGLPVVATAVKGHTDLLVDGHTGLLYPYGDSAAFAAAISRLLAEPALGMALGSAGRTAAQVYALDRVLPQVMARYTALLPAQFTVAEPVAFK